MLKAVQTIKKEKIWLIPFAYLLKIRKSPKIDTDKLISVHPAETYEELEQVLNIRWKCHKKYYQNKDDADDELDYNLNVTLLLAEDEYNNPIGTLRILDHKYGSIELGNYCDLRSFLHKQEEDCIEISRLSVLNHPKSELIKLFLWKAAILYCELNYIETILYSIPLDDAPPFMYFPWEDLGPSTIYAHPLVRKIKHHSFKIHIDKIRHALKLQDQLLYNFLFVKHHTNINLSSLLYI